MLEVSGYVGGEVSIHCSGSWTTDNSSELNNLYFCKGVCSRENILIQSERKRPIATQGRYRLEVNRGHGVFYVTIKRLRRADAGKYCCGVEKTFNTLYQDISLKVLNGKFLVRCRKIIAGNLMFYQSILPIYPVSRTGKSLL